MSISAPIMLTISEIARRLGQPIHRIEHVVRSRRMRPCAWAGNARVFSEEMLGAIAAELQTIAATKARGHSQDHCD